MTESSEEKTLTCPGCVNRVQGRPAPEPGVYDFACACGYTLHLQYDEKQRIVAAWKD